MKPSRKPLWLALSVVTLLAAGAAWLLLAQEDTGRSSASQDRKPSDNATLVANRGGTNDDSANGAPGRRPHGNDTEKIPGDGAPVIEPNFPDMPEDLPWDPADFTNDLLAWRLPTPRPDAVRPKPLDKYRGTPAFLDYGSTLRTMPERHEGADFFNPMQPDGMLVLDLSFYASYEGGKSLLASGVVDAISLDGTFVYSLSTHDRGNITFAIPYSYRRTETIGLSIMGPHMLPIEAVIGQAGSAGRYGASRANLRHEILVTGEVSPVLRIFSAGHSDFRQIIVHDADGNPKQNAVLTWDCVQILGRSDAGGVLRYPWPEVPANGGGKYTSQLPEKSFFVSAPGYVPVLLERSALAKAVGPVEVTLKARELLVSIHETVPHPEVLKLGANQNRDSCILSSGLDLFPVPDDWPEFNEWLDIHRALQYGFVPERFEVKMAGGEIRADDTIWRLQQHKTGSYEPGHNFGGEGAQKLADALGRQATEHWPEYARWYYGRWDYDEREGRFDVVLPFAGRFLLAVGEYNHGPKGDERNGGLTHVLYIDARNPARLQSKLLIHPQG